MGTRIPVIESVFYVCLTVSFLYRLFNILKALQMHKKNWIDDQVTFYGGRVGRQSTSKAASESPYARQSVRKSVVVVEKKEEVSDEESDSDGESDSDEEA